MTKSILGHAAIVRLAGWVERNRAECETAKYEDLAVMARHYTGADIPGLTLNNLKGALKAAGVVRRSRAGGDVVPDLRPYLTALARAVAGDARVTDADAALIHHAMEGEF